MDQLLPDKLKFFDNRIEEEKAERGRGSVSVTPAKILWVNDSAKKGQHLQKLLLK